MFVSRPALPFPSNFVVEPSYGKTLTMPKQASTYRIDKVVDSLRARAELASDLVQHAAGGFLVDMAIALCEGVDAGERG
jgi:hypothetical protein